MRRRILTLALLLLPCVADAEEEEPPPAPLAVENPPPPLPLPPPLPATLPPPPPASSELQLFELDDVIQQSVVKIAARVTQQSVEAPSIVTVITREEILQSGARDLLEILQLVPSFQFALDVEGIVGIAVRGQWGHEGKVLILVDGQRQNELLYSTTQFGNHYSADLIERIEIIRGPGSAIYGGFAALAVINIVTRTPKGLNGISVATRIGHMDRSFGTANLSLAYAQEFTTVPGLSVDVKAFLGQSKRSDQDYVDFSGNRYSMADQSALQNTMVSAGLTFRDLHFRLIWDDYQLQQRDGAGPVEPQAVQQKFSSLFLDLLYEGKLPHNLVLTPRLSYSRQTPWQITDKSSAQYYDKTVERVTGGLSLLYHGSKVQALGGVEGYLDHGHVNDPTLVGFQTLLRGKINLYVGNVAGYAQVIWPNFIVTATAGARVEWNSLFGASFVPRIALTRAFRRFHAKLLFSQAFRAPSLENLNINPTIVPERTNDLEGELGWKPNDHLQLSANVFWVRLDHPIIYGFNQQRSAEEYFNSDSTGSVGVEAEFRLKYHWVSLNLNYSFYSAANQNRAPVYGVPGHDDLLLGMAAHKLALAASIRLYRDHLFLNTTGTFLSERFTIVGVDGSGAPLLGSEPPVFLWNASFVYRNAGLRGLDIGLGAANLLGQPFRFLQAYSSDHPPLPGAAREIFIRLSYEHSLN